MIRTCRRAPHATALSAFRAPTRLRVGPDRRNRRARAARRAPRPARRFDVKLFRDARPELNGALGARRLLARFDVHGDGLYSLARFCRMVERSRAWRAKRRDDVRARAGRPRGLPGEIHAGRYRVGDEPRPRRDGVSRVRPPPRASHPARRDARVVGRRREPRETKVKSSARTKRRNADDVGARPSLRRGRRRFLHRS